MVLNVTIDDGEATHQKQVWAGAWTAQENHLYEGVVQLDDVYLKRSNNIVIRLDSDGNNGNDMTALRGWLIPSGKKDDTPAGIVITVL